MKVTDLTNYLNVLKKNEKRGLVHNCRFRVNSYMYNILLKLEKENLIEDLKKNRCFVTFKLKSILDLKLYRYPHMYLSKDNYSKIYNDLVKSKYMTALVSTCKNPFFLTLKQARALNIGGPIVALINSREDLS